MDLDEKNELWADFCYRKVARGGGRGVWLLRRQTFMLSIRI